MKKLLLALLACFVIFSFAACNQTQPQAQQSVDPKDTFDASKIYNDALEKTTALTSYDSVMYVDVTYNSDSVVLGTNSIISCVLDQSNADAPGLYYNVDSYDIEYDSHYINTLYYNEGWLYSSTSDGSKVKQELAAETMTEEYSEVPQLLLPEDAFKVAYEADGATHASISASKVQSFVDSCLSGAYGYFYSLDDDNEFDFNCSMVSISFSSNEEGYLNYADLHFTADFEHLEGKATATVDCKIEYNNPGQAVTVPALEGLEEYSLYDESAAQNQDEMSQEEIDELTGIMTEEVLAMYNFNDGVATRVSNFDQLYKEAVEKYGNEAVDNLVDTIEMMSGLDF